MDHSMQCKARSKRSKKQCLKWAVRGRTTCHMHGGKSKGPKTKEGKMRARQAAYKHGLNTQEALKQHLEIKSLIRQSKNLIQMIEG